MRQTTAGERLRAGRPLTEGRAAGLLRDILRPALSLIAGTRVPFRVVVEQPASRFRAGPWSSPPTIPASRTCRVQFGAPLVFPPQADKAESIALLRDTMVSLRWTFWEQNGVFSRADLDVGAERQKLLLALEEYPTLDWAYEQSCIFEA